MLKEWHVLHSCIHARSGSQEAETQVSCSHPLPSWISRQWIPGDVVGGLPYIFRILTAPYSTRHSLLCRVKATRNGSNHVQSLVGHLISGCPPFKRRKLYLTEWHRGSVRSLCMKTCGNKSEECSLWQDSLLFPLCNINSFWMILERRKSFKWLCLSQKTKAELEVYPLCWQF